jgi:hypothetical protein
VPREKRTSEVQKLMSRAFLADAQMFGPMLNMQYLGEDFATTWQKDPTKLFKSPEQMQQEQQQAIAMEAEQAGKGAVSPKQKLPTAEKAMGKEVKSALATA